MATTNVPGVDGRGYVAYGVLEIIATRPAGNVCSIDVNPSTGGTVVSLNGQSQEFAKGLIWTLSYAGGPQGGDNFQNNTAIQEYVTVLGGNNTVLGGSAWSTIMAYGDVNTIDSRVGGGYTFTYGGPNDVITAHPNDRVFAN
jgi:hypothetical protein